jgi:hypothetical protein
MPNALQLRPSVFFGAPREYHLRKKNAFETFHSLQNVAISSITLVVAAAFIRCTALLQVFGRVEAIVDALKSRFDGLPIHRQCYYQSYQPEILEATALCCVGECTK